MTKQDVFAAVAKRMTEGIMVHEQFMSTYLFLGLVGYSKCHEYHFHSESKSYAEVCRYSIEHFNRMIKPDSIVPPDVIPDSWYEADRDVATSQNRFEAMKALLDGWIRWERDSYKIYTDAYMELLNSEELAAAEFIKKYALDAEEELTWASDERLNKSAMSFDIVSIIEEQKDMKNWFSKQIRKSFKES